MKKLLSVVLLTACQTVIDPSVEAIVAKDLTVIASACEAMPGRGADICRVQENQPINSVWRLVLPTSRAIEGGEINVYYKDVVKSYAVTGAVVEIPWTDITGQKTWSLDHHGIASAIAVIQYKDAQGIKTQLRMRGMALIIVTREGYAPMPIDSGFHATEGRCRYQYSTKGRSALECK